MTPVTKSQSTLVPADQVTRLSDEDVEEINRMFITYGKQADENNRAVNPWSSEDQED